MFIGYFINICRKKVIIKTKSSTERAQYTSKILYYVKPNVITAKNAISSKTCNNLV